MPSLNWIGKEKVVNHHQDVPYRVLVHKYGFNEEGQTDNELPTENMVIHGDNLAALKSLLPKYENRIKCITIDPPYNTGNEMWAYNDNVSHPQIKKWLGDVVGKEGEDLSRHDKWLCMMYPRLKLLQKLLSDDGAIFICVDDNEQASMKYICNEIFGSKNFVAQVVWQKRTSPDARKRISDGHEYILVYLKNIERSDEAFQLLKLSGEDASKYKNPDNDPRGPWVSTDFGAQGYRPNQMYTIVTPGGAKHKPSDGRCWKNTEDVFKRLCSEGRMWFGKNGKGVPRKKLYLEEREGKNIWTWWPNAEVGHTQEATQDIKKIFGTKTIFDYPKPVRLIKRIIQIATSNNSIVLDSFSGSGTAAHALLSLNQDDKGERSFILIEMEDYADNITAERVKRVIQGYSDVPGTGGKFNFYSLGDPVFDETGNLNPDLHVDKIKEYIYFMETRTPINLETIKAMDHPYFIGRHNREDIYFYYQKDAVTTLDDDFLATIKEKADGCTIYADQCRLSENLMKKLNITFKMIPRDIAKL